MSQLSRLLSLSSRLYSKRFQIAIPLRATAVIQQPPMRFTARIARPLTEETQERPGFDETAPMRDILRTLNEQVQRSGRVVSRTVEEAITRAESLGAISGVETQLLLRATGSFLKDLPAAEREKLAERVWNLTPKERLDISHYNTLLHVKLENGSDFDPTSFLQELSDAKIAPNRVTYQRLVQRYCDLGDIQNATKIIEFMKSQNAAITEKIFHALIVGHLRAGNPESAWNILNVMESANMRPSGETHTVLAVGLAESGDTSGALKIMSDRHLVDEQILRVTKALAMNGDSEALEQALDALSDATVNFSFVNSICIELVVNGKLDAAIQIFKRLHVKSLKRDGGNFLVLHAARCGFSASEVLRMCEELKDGVDKDIFIEATRLVVGCGDRARSEEYIGKMRDLGFPIRAHYFYPFLVAARSEAEVLAELKHIASIEAPTQDLLLDFVLPRMECSDVNKAHAQLVGAGVATEEASIVLAIHLLKQARLEECEKLLKEHESSRLSRLAPLVAIAVKRDGDLPTAIRILGIISENTEIRLDVVARFLDNSGRLINDAIKAISETKLPLSSKSYNRLRTSGINVEPLSANVVNVSEHRSNDDIDVDRPTEELESLLVRCEEANKDVTRLLRRLLNDYCKQRRLDKVEEMLRKLPVEELTAANLSHLTEFYTHENNSERAIYFCEQALQRNFHMNPYRILGLARLLVEQKRLFEASELVEKASSNISLTLESFPIDKSSGALLGAIYENYGKDACFNFYERYISKHVDTRALGFILMELIGKDALEAFELFKEIVQKYGQAPCKRRLCKELIEKDKTEEIATLRDIWIGTNGAIDCAADMTICYLECGKLDRAKETLTLCTGRRGKANLVRACNTYMNEGRMEDLDALLGLMEEVLIQKDVSTLYRIKQYNKQNNVASALELWTQAQEDNLVLLPAALEILAELLERNGEPVPFVVPERQNTYGDGMLKSSEFVEILEESPIKAMEYREKLKSQGRRLKNTETASLIHELINIDKMKEAFEVAEDLGDSASSGDRVKVAIRRLMGVAASKGMIEEIEAVRPTVGELGSYYTQRAYLNAGRFEEFLTKLESDPSADTRVFVTRELLESSPAVLARLEEIAHRFAVERQDYYNVGSLFYLYIMKSETEKAVELQNKYPGMLELLQRLRIPTSFKRNLSQDCFERILRVTEDSEFRRKALLCALLELTQDGRIEEAKVCLKLGQEVGVSTSGFSASLMQKLSREVQEDAPGNSNGSETHRGEVEARSA